MVFSLSEVSRRVYQNIKSLIRLEQLKWLINYDSTRWYMKKILYTIFKHIEAKTYERTICFKST